LYLAQNRPRIRTKLQNMVQHYSSIEFDGNGKQSAETTTPSSTVPSIFPV
jgi:hypothetical protein